MKFKNTLLVVKDIEKAKDFYQKVLGLHVTLDLGANVTLTGGITLQTEETWKEFIHEEVTFKGKDTELYFEEDNFECFIKKLEEMKEICYVHSVMEHRWGQKAVRFYDLDGHIIEVGENMKMVGKRFLNSGMSIEQVARRMEVPIKFVLACRR